MANIEKDQITQFAESAGVAEVTGTDFAAVRIIEPASVIRYANYSLEEDPSVDPLHKEHTSSFINAEITKAGERLGRPTKVLITGVGAGNDIDLASIVERADVSHLTLSDINWASIQHAAAQIPEEKRPTTSIVVADVIGASHKLGEFIASEAATNAEGGIESYIELFDAMLEEFDTDGYTEDETNTALVSVFARLIDKLVATFEPPHLNPDVQYDLIVSPVTITQLIHGVQSLGEEISAATNEDTFINHLPIVLGSYRYLVKRLAGVYLGSLFRQLAPAGRIIMTGDIIACQKVLETGEMYTRNQIAKHTSMINFVEDVLNIEGIQGVEVEKADEPSDWMWRFVDPDKTKESQFEFFHLVEAIVLSKKA